MKACEAKTKSKAGKKRCRSAKNKRSYEKKVKKCLSDCKKLDKRRKKKYSTCIVERKCV